MTKGALFTQTGPCTVNGHLPSDIAFIKEDARILLYINNA